MESELSSLSKTIKDLSTNIVWEVVQHLQSPTGALTQMSKKIDSGHAQISASLTANNLVLKQLLWSHSPTRKIQHKTTPSPSKTHLMELDKEAGTQ